MVRKDSGYEDYSENTRTTVDYLLIISVVLVICVHGSLVAEYRELPRVFALAYKAANGWQSRQPKAYTLGTGHVLFFYDKLMYLAKRHQELVAEMQRRGYNPTFTGSLWKEWRDVIPASYWNDYTPTVAAVDINKERINARLRGE